MAVVRDDHRHWWSEELHDLPVENVLTEPANRGTAVAILHALVHVLPRDAGPALVLLPSDHAVDDESVLIESIDLAARLAAASPEHVFLLGMVPESEETEYGWVLPFRGGGRVRAVSRFVEKPGRKLAAELRAEGALWNSFICVASGHALLELFEGIQAHMLSRYLQFFLARQEHDPRELAMFQALPSMDFCGEILESAAGRLRVLVVPPCGWTDLGTPLRIDRWLLRSDSDAASLMVRASHSTRQDGAPIFIRVEDQVTRDDVASFH